MCVAGGGGGETPLCLAAEAGHARILRALLTHGAEVNTADEFGFTPLHLAASGATGAGGHESAIWLLLDAGADKGAHDGDNLRPLDHLSSEASAAVRGALDPERPSD
ncbi:MAG: ankyrin repeat domain-containing protein [bacterium]|nr:ankyrin repeat domain-containing protein [bacterium]